MVVVGGRGVGGGEEWSGTWWQACCTGEEGVHRKLAKEITEPKEPGSAVSSGEPWGLTTLTKRVCRFGLSCRSSAKLWNHGAEEQGSASSTATAQLSVTAVENYIQEVRQLCSQPDHFTSHMSHVHMPLEGPELYLTNSRLVFFDFLKQKYCSTETKRLQKVLKGLTVAISQRLTCSSSHENSAPFQLTDIQGYIITISAAQSIWVSLHSNTDYGVVQSWAVLYRVSWLLQPPPK